VTVALYTTIWLSLIGLLLGELGRRQQRRTLAPIRWAQACSAAAIALGVAHSLFALGVVYGWNHDRAVELTAARAAQVYGVGWAGSLYVNYVFLAWWTADTLWWWQSPGTFGRRSSTIEWLWRLTAFTMVVNGAVIFASPAGRLAGVPLVAGLLWAWFGKAPKPVRAA
jgi:hypothetical protein